MLALDMLLIVSALENVDEGNAKPSKVRCQSSFMRGLLRSNGSGTRISGSNGSSTRNSGNSDGSDARSSYFRVLMEAPWIWSNGKSCM